MAKGYKTGGRSRNTPNKLTKKIRGTLTLIISKELEQLPERLKNLSNMDRLTVLIKLIPFVLPKACEEIDLTIKGEEIPTSIHITMDQVPEGQELPSDEMQIDLTRDKRFT